MASKLIKEIFNVCYETKEEIIKRLEKYDYEAVTRDEFNNIVTDSIVKTSIQFNVRDSTIYAAIGRNIDLDINTFRDKLFGLITNQNSDLIDFIIINSRKSLDDKASIKAMFLTL